MAVTTSSYGTLSISDLLRVNNTSIIDFGIQNVYGPIRAYLAAYNALLADQLGTLAQKTVERVKGTGGPVSMIATYTDEGGLPDAQKIGNPSIMGYPLRKHTVTVQWTAQWMMNATPAEAAAQAIAARVADLQKVQFALRKAIFTPTNTTFTDILRDNMPIPVKAFANADGYPIPPAPNGFVFNPSTHTHYMGTTGTGGTTLVAADVDALLANVLEHVNGGQLYLYVSQDVESTMNAGRFATPSTFPLYSPKAYVEQILPTNQGFFNEGQLAQSQPFNRITGRYRDAIVYVKPWMPFGTLFAFVAGDEKPVAFRIRATLDGQGRYNTDMTGGDNGDFRMVLQNIDVPLTCQIWEREYGFGVQNRVAAATMAVGSSTYTMPNITTGSSQYMV